MSNEFPRISETEARLNTHEAVCAERYEGIQDSLEKGEKRMARLDDRTERLDKRSQRLEFLIYIAIGLMFAGPRITAKILEIFFK